MENVLLTSKQNPDIKVVDFGVAGICAGVNTDKSEAGSLRYMAPELLSGKVKMVHPS